MIKGMMNKLTGRKETVTVEKNLFGKTKRTITTVETKGLFGKTNVEVKIEDNKGNVVVGKMQRNDRIRNERKIETTEEKLAKRGFMSTEEKLAAKRNRENKKTEVEVEVEVSSTKRVVNKAVVAAGVGVGMVAATGSYAVSRYNKVVARDESETIETLNMEEIKDILD